MGLVAEEVVNDDVGGSGAADTGDPWGVVLSSTVFFLK